MQYAENPSFIINKTAILLIDMQKTYLDTKQKRALIPNQIELLDFAQKNNIPVFVAELRGQGSTVAPLATKLSEFPKRNVKTVIKNSNNAFNQTTLHKLISKKGKTTLILAGINAGYCVFETALNAKRHGYTVISSANLIAGYNDNYRPQITETWYSENIVYTKTHTDIIKAL